MSTKHLIGPDRLFLKTLIDLEERVVSNDPYETLGIAGLVRKLFLDDHPLVDQVNRGRRMKLRFATVKTKSKDVLRKSLTTHYDVGDALDPALHPAIAKDIVIVGRDAFFGSLVVYFADQAITIRDIVTFEANIAGGVHAPNPAKEAAHQGLDALRQHVIMKGQSISLYHLRNVGKLVLDALEPLRGRVEHESSAG